MIEVYEKAWKLRLWPSQFRDLVAATKGGGTRQHSALSASNALSCNACLISDRAYLQAPCSIQYRAQEVNKTSLLYYLEEPYLILYRAQEGCGFQTFWRHTSSAQYSIEHRRVVTWSFGVKKLCSISYRAHEGPTILGLF